MSLASNLSTPVTAQNAVDTESWPYQRHDKLHTGFNAGATAPTDGFQFVSKFPADMGFIAEPILKDRWVYFGTREQGIHAGDPITKASKWHVETPGPSIALGIEAGTVYAISLDVDSMAGTFYVIDAQNGQILDRSTSDSALFPVEIRDGTILGTSFDGTVYERSRPGMTPVWRTDLNGVVANSQTVSDDQIYVGTIHGMEPSEVNMSKPHEMDAPGRLYSISTDDGSIDWVFKMDQFTLSSPAIAEGTVYFGSFDNRVYAVDAGTGEEKWRVPTGNSVHSSVAVAEKTVYAGSDDGSIYAIDAETGTGLWTFETDGWVRASPAVVGDTVYVGSDDHMVYALNATNGELRWSFEAGSLVRSVVPGYGRVHFGTFDGMYTLQEGASTSGSIEDEAPEETDISRGFFTNGDDVGLNPITDPFVLTVGGFILSVAGIVHQMLGGR